MGNPFLGLKLKHNSLGFRAAASARSTLAALASISLSTSGALPSSAFGTFSARIAGTPAALAWPWLFAGTCFRKTWVGWSPCSAGRTGSLLLVEQDLLAHVASDGLCQRNRDSSAEDAGRPRVADGLPAAFCKKEGQVSSKSLNEGFCNRRDARMLRAEVADVPEDGEVSFAARGIFEVHKSQLGPWQVDKVIPWSLEAEGCCSDIEHGHELRVGHLREGASQDQGCST
eukprot:CAMPEP_0181475178 /NCGR_PEP_ID=MMETSP1110-20121109/41048_1 /TAXON_ID=174948 /ORGANISM="Symbiodinium sp., Strain CCMP421" /LENGTH=228 /DNA_ID=CAMNT_0023600403 /DNA_START=92 /DNA_END=775 /DNA_ORIENTATION=-